MTWGPAQNQPYQPQPCPAQPFQPQFQQPAPALSEPFLIVREPGPGGPKQGKRRRVWLIALPVLLVPVLLCLMVVNGLMGTNWWKRHSMKDDIREYFRNSAGIQRAGVLDQGDFPHGHEIIVNAELKPGVSANDVCQLLIGADQRFLQAKQEALDVNLITVKFTGTIPGVDGNLKTSVPFHGGDDGFTKHDGSGVCSR